MRTIKPLLGAILAAGLLAGCGSTAQPLPPETTIPAAVEEEVGQMTLRQKVGQLFIVRPEALDADYVVTPQPDTPGVTTLTDNMKAMLECYPVGGIAMFGKNIENPEQITALNAALQEESAIPLFIAIDEEGGTVSRIAPNDAFDVPHFPSAAYVETEEAAREMGRAIGVYLKEYGFNFDFAPVADVNTNPNNPIIGDRSFSPNPETAASLASAMAEGLGEMGVIASYKHFPGHGDTAEDSHAGLAVSRKSAADMMDCEWIPFRAASDSSFVMVGHIAVPEITGDMTPSTLSPAVITGVLKGQLDFGGLVITDAMEMGAIIQLHGSAEAALLAFGAGADVLLMPENLEEAFEAVVRAVEDGTLSMQWLDAAAERVLQFKRLHGIIPDA